MFAFLQNFAQNVWMTALWLLWAALLFGGFIFDGGIERRMPAWTRMGSSFTLVLAAFSWFFISHAAGLERYALLLALGMTAGLLGDLWLAGWLGGRRNVLGGMAAFGLGHILYIAAIWGYGDGQGLDTAVVRWAALFLWWFVALAGWYTIVFRGARPTKLHWAALPYALLLATTAGAASGLAWQAPIFLPLALGAALFLLSDLILAGQLFGGLDFPLIGDVKWLLYGPGQMLIVYSVASALIVNG